jgi:uncharacterized damage-inducible protein DinB
MTFVEAFVEHYRAAHQTLVSEIGVLSDEAINWIPCEGANSIAVLVTHLLGNEVESLNVVTGAPSGRNRPAEFAVRAATSDQLLTLINQADATLEELGTRIQPNELEASFVRPAALDQTPRPGIFLLLHSVTHAREHLGQILLTKQLYLSSTRP